MLRFERKSQLLTGSQSRYHRSVQASTRPCPWRGAQPSAPDRGLEALHQSIFSMITVHPAPLVPPLLADYVFSRDTWTSPVCSDGRFPLLVQRPDFLSARRLCVRTPRTGSASPILRLHSCSACSEFPVVRPVWHANPAIRGLAMVSPRFGLSHKSWSLWTILLLTRVLPTQCYLCQMLPVAIV